MNPSESHSHPSRPGVPKSKRLVAFLILSGVLLLGFSLGVGVTASFIPKKFVQMMEEKSGPDFMVERFEKAMLGDLDLNPDQEKQIQLQLETFHQELLEIRAETVPKVLQVVESRLTSVEAVLDEAQAAPFRQEAQLFLERLESIVQP